MSNTTPRAARALKPSPATTATPSVQPAQPAPPTQQPLAATAQSLLPPQSSSGNPRKRRASGQPPTANATSSGVTAQPTAPGTESTMSTQNAADAGASAAAPAATTAGAAQPPPAKKGRTNTPWTAAEEQKLKQMRDQGLSWSEIAKSFPARTEGSVKKHWYKDMHYAEFAEDESAALLAAIKEYEQNKWKAIGQKVGKPAKACEQYAKEHFGGKI